jgi:hypothetical protein
MYERILYDTYTKLNKGLEYIQDVQGHGCPLGMDPITPEELEYDRRTSAYDDDGRKKIIELPIKRFLYDNKEAYIKHLKSIGQWPMECNKKTMTEDRYEYVRNSIFKMYK